MREQFETKDKNCTSQCDKKSEIFIGTNDVVLSILKIK
jgi:hypothetical protein